MSTEYTLAVTLPREDWEAIAADVHRAAVNAALDTENEERQGIAADLNRVVEILNAALDGTPERGWERFAPGGDASMARPYGTVPYHDGTSPYSRYEEG